MNLVLWLLCIAILNELIFVFTVYCFEVLKYLYCEEQKKIFYYSIEPVYPFITILKNLLQLFHVFQKFVDFFETIKISIVNHWSET